MNRNHRSTTCRILTAGVLGLAALGLAPLAAQAFGPGRRDAPPERAAQRLAEELSLTAEQQEQVRAILRDSFDRRRDMRKAHRGERDALREQTHQELASVLTPEQVEQLDQLRQNRQQLRERRRDCDRWSGRRGGGACGPSELSARRTRVGARDAGGVRIDPREVLG